MAELYGVAGKIARVDLTAGTVSVIEPDEKVYRKFLGGSALGAYYLFKEGIYDPNLDPLGPDNLLQFMVGPVTGGSPNARITLVTKSAYNFFCASTCGGHFGAELKFAGWDGIQVVGKASKPVYLAVVDDKIEIRDASHVWGMGVEEAELILKSEVLAETEYREGMIRDADLTPEWAALRPPKRQGLNNKRLAHVMAIGPGGENQVWYSCVVTEGARAAGRYGAGAVMGSKNLKAVVVRGTKGHKLADKKTFLALINGLQKTELKNIQRRLYGTTGAGGAHSYVEDGYPIRNWQWCSWSDPNMRSIAGPFIDSASFVRHQSCYGCNMPCLKPVEITSKDPMLNGVLSDMPDWEAMGMVGGNLGYMEMEGADPAQPFKGTIKDQAENLAKLQYTTFLHDNYSLDFIEGGNNLALLMELIQRGFIDKTDLDGIDLKWGDVHAVDALFKKIVYREGIGDKLAQGTYETARYFAELKGKPEILDYSQTAHFYGQPAHGTRSPVKKNALEYVTVNRPCSHVGGGGAGFAKDDYAAAITDQNEVAATNSLVFCYFSQGEWGSFKIDLIKAATGWNDFTIEELREIGAREYALSRLFDVHVRQLKDPKAEWDRQTPPRWFNDPLPNGPFKGSQSYDGKPDVLYNEALPAYWKERGWTEDKGIPTQETLKKLGIEDIAGDIAAKHM